MIVIECPSCGKTYANIKPALIGQSTRCKGCQTKFVIEISESSGTKKSSNDFLESGPKTRQDFGDPKAKRQSEKSIDDEFVEFADEWLSQDGEPVSKNQEKLTGRTSRIKEETYELLTEKKSSIPPGLKPEVLPRIKSDESRVVQNPPKVSTRAVQGVASRSESARLTKARNIQSDDLPGSDSEEVGYRAPTWNQNWTVAIACAFVGIGLLVSLIIVTTAGSNSKNEEVTEKPVTEKPKSEATIPVKPVIPESPKREIDQFASKAPDPTKKEEPLKNETIKKGIYESDDPEVQKGIDNVVYTYKPGTVPKDMEERIYNQALLETTKGNVRSSVIAGMCEIRGAGTIQNIKTGEAKLIKAATGDDLFAIFLLGRLYYLGEISEKNEVESRRWYKKGAELNDESCKTRYGYFLAEGIGGPVDREAGLKILIESANQKDSLGMYFLGKIYLNDQDKTNDNQIEDLLEGSARSGLIATMRLLSKAYLNGQLGEKNPGKGVEWLRNAAEKGDAESQEELGDLLFFGNKGVAKDLVEAKKWLEKAGLNGRSGAYISLGLMARSQRDYGEARKNWDQAEAMGSNYATALIGETAMDLARDQDDIAQAMSLLDKAAQKGSTPALFQMAKFYVFGKTIKDSRGNEIVVGLNPTKGFDLCKLAAERDEVSAMQLLADLYSDGIGTVKNKVTAQKWRTAAAKARRAANDE